MAYRISVDTGGTFTDVVVVDDNGQLRIGKALTTPRRAFQEDRCFHGDKRQWYEFSEATAALLSIVTVASWRVL